MPDLKRVVMSSPMPGVVRLLEGYDVDVPVGWVLLKPGDATLTRRVKQQCPHWVMEEKKGRRTFSKGVWAPRDQIETIRRALKAERATPAYAQKLEASRKRSATKQVAYVQSFHQAVLDYLNFSPEHEALAVDMAQAITAHATPVGSGTVARTERIPIEKRAKSAVIAWMRHQTTGYDRMQIARVKGRRREVRQTLAKRSVQLLARYRAGAGPHAGDQTCPLLKALR